MIITIILMINMGRSWELGVCDRPTERSRLSRLKSRGATIIITNSIIIIMFAYDVFLFFDNPFSVIFTKSSLFGLSLTSDTNLFKVAFFVLGPFDTYFRRHFLRTSICIK